MTGLKLYKYIFACCGYLHKRKFDIGAIRYKYRSVRHHRDYRFKIVVVVNFMRCIPSEVPFSQFIEASINNFGGRYLNLRQLLPHN
jgi:hypothetical protein